MSKILITGGAGFIASHIADRYLELGHEVVIIDNMVSGQKENIPSKAKFYEMDICDPKVKEVFQKERPDILSHHAAQIDVRKSVADPKFDVDVNIGGIINLMQGSVGCGLKRVIFASSGGAAYGEQTAFPADENHPIRAISPYGINKFAGERFFDFFSLVQKFDTVFLRYANIYGERQNSHGEAGVIAIFAKKLLSGEQPLINGEGTQTRDYVHVSDVVKANVIALNPKAHGAYNVGTSVETDVNTLFKLLNRFAGNKAVEKHGESKVGEQMRSVLVSARLKAEFGFSPEVKLETGLEQTFQWFKKRLG